MQTTRRRGRRTNAIPRNTTGGNSGTGNACKLNATAAAQYGQFCSLLAATGNYTIPQMLDQQSLWLISHAATAGIATTANLAGTTASKAIVAPTRPRRTSRAPATAAPRRARRTRATTGKQGGEISDKAKDLLNYMQQHPTATFTAKQLAQVSPFSSWGTPKTRDRSISATARGLADRNILTKDGTGWQLAQIRQAA